MKHLIKILSVTLVFFIFHACGSDASNDATSGRSASQSGQQELTDFQLEHGIGPVTSTISLGAIDEQLVKQGRTIYEMKCEMCHSMTNRMVGPPLGDIMERRSAEFVMNMILNPQEMTQKHPEGQKMLREYMTIMPFQNVQRDEARAIVEFLRTVSK